MPFVSITRLRVRSWQFLPGFFYQTLRSALQVRSAEGQLHFGLLRDAHNTYWTRTVWTSEQAMKAFMTSGAHRHAMPRLLKWCDEAAIAHWNQDSPDPPGWNEAHRQLLAIGRPSKVLYPTEAHRRHDLPLPRLQGPQGETK
ncbi:MAG TPA: antibiotic biosynthesis monooxygenase [Candidatus Saccharimonadales bacterium]|nr:antibiotic biosynthesis monooxygenase [Candidatus Saccharimonadales bacterium]